MVWWCLCCGLVKHIAAAHTMPNPTHQLQQLLQANATIGPWDSGEFPRHPQCSGDNFQAVVLASSSTCDPGSWCESVETPISRVHPAKQVAPSCPPPTNLKLHDHARAKLIARVLCGSHKGKLDPGTSLQTTSTQAGCSPGGPTSLRWRGSTTSFQRVQGHSARSRNKNVSNTGLGSSNSNRSDQCFSEGSPAATTAAPSGKEPSSNNSITLFVRSRQWGLRRSSGTEWFGGSAEGSDALCGRQLTITGGKRPRPLTAGESAKQGRAADGGSNVEEVTDRRLNSRSGRDVDRRNGARAEENRNESTNRRSVSSDIVVVGGQGRAQGPAERESTEGTTSTSFGPATLVVTLAAVSTAKVPPSTVRSKAETPSERGRVVTPPTPTSSKLRLDARRQFYYERQQTEGSAEEKQGVTYGHVPVTTGGEEKATASVTPTVEPGSVVGVWARTPSRREAATKTTSLPLQPGVHRSHEVGLRVVGDFGKFQARQPSAALRRLENVMSEVPCGSGTKTETVRAGRARRRRRRPASAGLSYFRAHLSGDANAAAAKLQGRGAGGAVNTAISSRGEECPPLPFSPKNSGGTVPRAVDAAGARSAVLSDSMAVTVENEGTDSPLAEATAVKEGEGGSGPGIATTATMAAADRTPWSPAPRRKAGTSNSPDSRRSPPQSQGAATAAIAPGVASLSPRRVGHQAPAPREAATATPGKPPSAARAERQHRPQHVSTLEMFSAMTRRSPTAPPECVTGLEIPIATRPARSSLRSPRRFQNTNGAGDRARVAAGRYNPERHAVLPASKQQGFRADPSVAAPCNMLRRSFSWTGGDEKHAAASGGGWDHTVGRAEALRPPSEKKREGSVGSFSGGDERLPEPSSSSCCWRCYCADGLQLFVEDTSVIEARVCGELAGMGLPGRRGCGRGGELGKGAVALQGDRQPRKETPFSRFVSSNQRPPPNPEAGTPQPKREPLVSLQRSCKTALSQPSTPYQYTAHDSKAFLRAILTAVSRKRIESKSKRAEQTGLAAEPESSR